MPEKGQGKAIKWFLGILIPILLGGAGWLVQHYILRSYQPATLIIRNQGSPKQVNISIDGEEKGETSESGFA
ncbi:MAG: hypothetical protein MK033_08250 [Candidatus Caenarcaniphilales bacterium]|nr:hypothetical protein [Candidatus Caenarcaniphilales bacterium]